MEGERDRHAGPPDETLSGLAETVRACRGRDATTQGVPAYLLIGDSEASASRGSGRPGGEGAVLGVLAERILDHLVGVDGSPGECDVALALEVLAARFFAPGASDPPGPDGYGAGGGSPIAAAFSSGRYVRAVNFHSTPRRLAGRLKVYLSWLAQRFVPVTDDDLLRLASGGEWPHDRPGVVLSFYNGFRDNFEVAAPILDRVGLVGRFFVVAGWVATTTPEQRAFADGHRIVLPPDGDLSEDGRLALSPDEVASLAERGHIIASHTMTHASVTDLPPEAPERETAGSRHELERISRDHPVRALAWHGGAPLGLDAWADRALRSAGYELLFANHAVQRVR